MLVVVIHFTVRAKQVNKTLINYTVFKRAHVILEICERTFV